MGRGRAATGPWREAGAATRRVWDVMDSIADFVLKTIGSYEGINQESDKIRCFEKVFMASMWRIEW